MKRIFTAILSLALVSACFVSCQPDEQEVVEKELGATTVQFLNTKNPEVFYVFGETKTYTLEHVISGKVEGTEPTVEAPKGWTVVYVVEDEVATVTVTAPADDEGAASGAVVIKGKDNIEREATATLNVLRREPDAVAFGSEIFREYLAANYDTDKDGALSMEELQAITVLDLRGKELTPGFRYEGLGITSLAGIENLTGLTELYISNNNVGEVDLSKNTELKVLHAYFCGLDAIDLSKNTKIEELYCFHNNLSTLDLSAQSKLTALDCQSNNLESVTFANGVKLTSLNIAKNKFETFDATKHAELTSFDFSNNLLTAIDVTACSKLESLNAENNLLEAIDLSSLSNATVINLTNNNLTSVDFSACAALTDLYAAENALETADLGGCANLVNADLTSNNLTSIAMSGLDKLEVLTCANNALTEINLAGCTNLKRLSAFNNKLAAIDLTAAPSLTYAKMYGNPFTSVNINGMTALEYLALVNYDAKADRFSEGNIRYVRDDKGTIQNDDNGQPMRRFYFTGLSTANLSLDLNGMGITELYVFGNSSLVNLDITKCTEIETLEASANKLASIDLSQNTALKSINLAKNNLQEVSLKGLENLTSANISGMSSLNKIDLEGVTSTLTNLFVAKDSENALSWGSSSGTFTVKNSNLTSLSLNLANTTIKKVVVTGNANLNTLDLSEGCEVVTEVQCNSNNLSDIDVSSCTALLTLNCNSNAVLSSIDLSNNAKLLTLEISENRLNSIDLSAQTNLTKLVIKDTYLSALDLTASTTSADKLKVDCKNSPNLNTLLLPNGFDVKNLTCDEGLVPTIAGEKVKVGASTTGF